MTLVHRATGLPWSPSDVLKKTVSTATVSYADGRTETVYVGPYQIEIRAPANIETAYSDAELTALGLARPLPALTVKELAAEGKRRVAGAQPRYEPLGGDRDTDPFKTVYDTEDIPPPTAYDLIAYAKDKRWRKETGGIVVAGVAVATDDKSQGKITGGRIAADADPDWTTVWDGADGNSYPINAAAMIAISDAVQAHVNSCFVIYADVKAKIAAGTITTTAEIDAAFA